MTLLYPHFLWLCIPLFVLLIRSKKELQVQVHLLILLLLLLSLSRPVQEKALVKTPMQSQEIIIALDASYSMQAKDISPDRYTFAMETIYSLLDHNPSATIMLMVFTSNPLILSPPTTDHLLIKTALKSLNPAFILTKGTSLEKLFDTLSVIQAKHQRAQSLLLITDGGEEQDSAKLHNLLQDTHLSLITLALGTQKGSTLTQEEGNLLKNKEGHLVITAINPMLASLTAAVGGSYLTARASPEDTALEITDRLKTQAQHPIEKMQHHYREWYQIPLLLATLLFLMLHTKAVKYLGILFLFLGIEAEASFLDNYYLHQAYQAYDEVDFNRSNQLLQKIETPSLQRRILLANIAYKTSAFTQAIAYYQSIHSRTAKVKQQLYYNIANAYVHLGKYSQARSYYTKALQLGVDADVVYNFSLIVSLKDIKDAPLGRSHPKSQQATASPSTSQKESKATKEKQSSTGSGAGGGNSKKKNKKQKEPHTLLEEQPTYKHPLGSKVYELINKGYIYEKTPW